MRLPMPRNLRPLSVLKQDACLRLPSLFAGPVPALYATTLETAAAPNELLFHFVTAPASHQDSSRHRRKEGEMPFVSMWLKTISSSAFWGFWDAVPFLPLGRILSHPYRQRMEGKVTRLIQQGVIDHAMPSYSRQTCLKSGRDNDNFKVGFILFATMRLI